MDLSVYPGSNQDILNQLKELHIWKISKFLQKPIEEVRNQLTDILPLAKKLATEKRNEVSEKWHEADLLLLSFYEIETFERRISDKN